MQANNTRARTSPYLISSPVDLALVGGLSVAVCAVYRWTDLGDMSARLLAGGVLTFLVNWPHFAATNVRLYGSKSSIAQYPITAVASPLVVLLLVVASLRSPLLIAPAFFKMFLIWSPSHYSGQTLGVSMLYARRAGFRVETWCRAALSAFIYLTFISESAATELSPMGTLYFGVRLPTFNLPEGLPPFLRGAMYLAGGVGLLGLILGSLRQSRVPPLPLLLVPLSQYVWFVGGSGVTGFRELVPAFHSLQYLVIAWAMQAGSSAGDSRVRSGFWKFARLGRWMAWNLAGGAVLFSLLPKIPGSLGYVQPLLAAGVITTAVQVHHFFVDGVIWKLRSRAVSAPLLETGNHQTDNSTQPALELAA